MIWQDHEQDDVQLRRRWPGAQHVLRRLPHLESEPADLEAILALTVSCQARLAPADGERRDPPARQRPGVSDARWRSASRRFLGAAAMAASLVVAAAGAWIWNEPADGQQWSEAELAELDAEVEVVLVRLGHFLGESGRMAIDGVLGEPQTSEN